MAALGEMMAPAIAPRAYHCAGVGFGAPDLAVDAPDWNVLTNELSCVEARRSVMYIHPRDAGVGFSSGAHDVRRVFEEIG